MTITIKSRIVTVTGPRGTLVRNFKHCPLDIQLGHTTIVPATKSSPASKTFVAGEDGKSMKLEMWFSTKKQLSTLGSIMSHITNMMTGVVQVRHELRALPGGLQAFAWLSRARLRGGIRAEGLGFGTARAVERRHRAETVPWHSLAAVGQSAVAEAVAVAAAGCCSRSSSRGCGDRFRGLCSAADIVGPRGLLGSGVAPQTFAMI